MIDAFALLDQPRRPWLDSEQLKAAFHAKALQAHPDAQSPGGDSDAFAKLNDAHQILQDPKRRLQHLLTLEARPPSKTPDSVPPEIEELFPAVAEATRAIDDMAAKATRTSNALARSLLKSEFLETNARVNSLLARLSDLEQRTMIDMRNADANWNESSADQLKQLEGLYVLLSYLTRWTGDLQEKQTQLSIHAQ